MICSRKKRGSRKRAKKKIGNKSHWLHVEIDGTKKCFFSIPFLILCMSVHFPIVVTQEFNAVFTGPEYIIGNRQLNITEHNRIELGHYSGTFSFSFVLQFYYIKVLSNQASN
jgi:uncharacterized membrane protein